MKLYFILWFCLVPLTYSVCNYLDTKTKKLKGSLKSNEELNLADILFGLSFYGFWIYISYRLWYL